MSDRTSYAEPVSSPRGLVIRLAYAIVIGPLCALIMQLLAFIGVSWACGHSSLPPVHVIPATFLALTLLGFAMARRDWSAANDGGRRTRFLALSGMILSAFSALVVAGMWSPLFLFHPC